MSHSVDKLVKLAERFARKLSLAQPIVSADPKTVVVDAMFDKPNTSSEQGYEKFQQAASGGQFAQAVADLMDKARLSKIDLTIGATVNSPAGQADFIVKSVPAVSAAQLNDLKTALVRDYTSLYRQTPATRAKSRDPGAVATAPTIFTIGLG